MEENGTVKSIDALETLKAYIPEAQMKNIALEIYTEEVRSKVKQVIEARTGSGLYGSFADLVLNVVGKEYVEFTKQNYDQQIRTIIEQELNNVDRIEYESNDNSEIAYWPRLRESIKYSLNNFADKWCKEHEAEITAMMKDDVERTVKKVINTVCNEGVMKKLTEVVTKSFDEIYQNCVTQTQQTDTGEEIKMPRDVEVGFFKQDGSNAPIGD